MLNVFDQNVQRFYASFPSITPGWITLRSPAASERRKDLMNCKRMELYLLSQGYSFTGPHTFFSSKPWKIYINAPFWRVMVPLKVKTPGFKVQSRVLIALNSILWFYVQDNTTWGLACLENETLAFSGAPKLIRVQLGLYSENTGVPG